MLARALAGSDVPYAVKIHGSALEYTVKPYPRFMPWAREGLAGARGVLVGSFHTGDSLWTAMQDPGLTARTRLGPPGVDVHTFEPREPAAAQAGLEHLVARLRELAAEEEGQEGEGSAFALDHAAAARALAGLDVTRDRLVAFTGKLIVSKGVSCFSLPGRSCSSTSRRRGWSWSASAPTARGWSGS